MICKIVVGVLLGVILKAILHAEALNLSRNKGFQIPIPLIKKSGEGWVAAVRGNRYEHDSLFSILLGSIELGYDDEREERRSETDLI